MDYEVLIVDDSSFMRKVVSKIFKTIPEIKTIHEAFDGESSIEMYKKIKPNLVTMDVDMPKMNGFDATKAIVSFDPDVKVVIVTSVDKPDTRKVAENSGACGFIKKPFQDEEVKKTVDKIIK